MYLPWTILTKIPISEQEAVVVQFIQQRGYCLYKAIQRSSADGWKLFANYMASNYGPLLFRCDLSKNEPKRGDVTHHDDIIVYLINQEPSTGVNRDRKTFKRVAFRNGLSAYRKSYFTKNDLDGLTIDAYHDELYVDMDRDYGVFTAGFDGQPVTNPAHVHPLYVMHGGDIDDPLSDEETDMVERAVNEQQLRNKTNTKRNMLLNDDSTTETDYKEIVKYILFTFVLACIVICIVKVVKSIHEEHGVIEKYSSKKRSCNRKSASKSVKRVA
jgi:hypothetical protein